MTESSLSPGTKKYPNSNYSPQTSSSIKTATQRKITPQSFIGTQHQHLHSKAKKANTISNTLEVPNSNSSLNQSTSKTRRLSERLKEIPVRPSKVLTNAVDYVNRRRNEIRQLNKYNRKLHCFFIFMILALVCLIQNWGGRIQYFLIGKMFTLAEDTIMFKSWRNSAQNVTTNFYLFNVTNPDEVLVGEKPNLVQVGPFKYKIIQKRLNVEFSDDLKINN